MAQWSDSKAQQNAATALSKLDAWLKPTANGGVSSTGVSTEVDTAVEIVAESTKYSDELPSAHRAGITRRAIYACKNAGRLDVAKYLREADTLEKGYLKQPSKPFVLVSTISITPPSSRLTLRSGTATISVTNKLPSRFSYPERLVKQEDQRPAIPKHHAFVRVTARSRDAHAALNQALDDLDLVRAIWNVFHSYRRFRMTIGASSADLLKPVNQIILGPVHTLYHPNGLPAYDSYWIDTNFAPGVAAKSIVNTYDQMRSFDLQIRDRIRRSSFRSFLTDLWLRLGRALDERDLHASFLKLWSTLELGTVTAGPQGSHEVTVRRAAFIWKDPAYAKLVLHHMRQWRNRMVHESATAGNAERLLYSLKRYVEELVLFLTWNAPGFKTIGDAAAFLDLPSDRKQLRRGLHRYKQAIAMLGR